MPMNTAHERLSRQVKSCKLHFEASPLKIVKASKQYMYDDMGIEYLDCVNNIAHVGHCHPHVVTTGQEQMAKLSTCPGFLNESLSTYSRSLLQTLPERLCVCYFVNSGSEANDLALRLAQAYTGHKDTVVIDDAYHGNLGNLIDISPQRFKSLQNGKKEHVHVVPCPNTYRGMYKENEPNPGIKYANEVKRVIETAHSNGRRIGAFLAEPLPSLCGVLTMPENYLKLAYRYIREAGGVCIADEVQVGLGRVGEHFWAFQAQDVVPDILTCGKPLGNGYPLAVVITSKEIADSLGDFNSSYGGNPVSCAIGQAVLDVIRNEKLLSSCKNVGRILMEGLNNIMPNHPMMGNVRGQGLMVGVEIVTDKESRKPAKEAAERLTYQLKEKRIIISNEGPDKNVMFICPPMCFTVDNALRLVNAMDKCLTDIESGIDIPAQPEISGSLNIPLDVISDSSSFPQKRKIETVSDSESEPDEKQARFEDID